MMTAVLSNLNKRPALELFLLSLAVLYLELLIIRWYTADYLLFAVFRTFPLVACFVGLGVGIGGANDKYFRHLPVAILLTIVIIKISQFMGIGELAFPSTSIYQWFDLGLSYGSRLGFFVILMALSALLLLLGPFATMVCLGSRIGKLFTELKPLSAYTVDLAGALLGSVIVAVLAFTTWPPNLLLVPIFILLIFLSQKKVFAAGFLAVAAAVALFPLRPLPLYATTVWSPYSVIERQDYLASYGAEPELIGCSLKLSHMFCQMFLDTDENKLAKMQAPPDMIELLRYFDRVRGRYFRLPYMLHKPQQVLVLGAGMGQDVLTAFQQGATHIDAVEIDPEIAKIGKQINPAYSSDRVNLVIGDGRQFMERSQKKYDLIIIACLDSQMTVGLGSSVRQDSFLHTRQAAERMLKLLTPDGIGVISFAAGDGSGWLRDRLYYTIKEACHYDPIFLTDDKAKEKTPAFIIIIGQPVAKGEIKIPSDSPFQLTSVGTSTQRALTDDWPYLYVKPHQIDVHYLVVLMSILLPAIYAGRRLLFSREDMPSQWQMFFLGGGFIVLELYAISKLALLYGATWLTSFVVINGILCLVLAANLVIVKTGAIRNLGWLYGLMAVSLLVSLLLPINEVLQYEGLVGVLGFAAVTIGTLLPCFAAGLIFSSAFSRAREPAKCFGMNLLGSVAGALLEYISVYWGFSCLVLLAGLFYGASWLCWLRLPQTDTKSVSGTGDENAAES